MGIDISPGRLHLSYSTFHHWRTTLCEAAGIVFEQSRKENGGLQILMDHSDCEGEISWQDCKEIANALKPLRKKIEDEQMLRFTNLFIASCDIAVKKQINMEFS